MILEKYGFAVAGLAYIALMLFGYFLLWARDKADYETTRSFKPVIVMAFLVVVFGVPAVFGSLWDWMPFELHMAALVISSASYLAAIYYMAFI